MARKNKAKDLQNGGLLSKSYIVYSLSKKLCPRILALLLLNTMP